MSRFPTAGHLCSWAKFTPVIEKSAGKKKGKNSTGHGNRYLARILGEAAVAAGKTPPLRHPQQTRSQETHPHPPARSPRLPRRPRTRRLTK
ncbi:transposase [Microtetraspora glauca]|uniref:Transposase n=1 Tax=Microtetraspora glauca TaxID=1996 RepID=A0ABV3GSA7_MICGL